MTAQTIKSLLDHLTVPTSEAQVEAWLDDLPNPHGGPHVVSFINAHAVNMADENAAFHEALLGRHSSLATRVRGKVAAAGAH